MIFFLRPGNGLDPILAFYTSGGHLLAYNDKEINYNTGGPAKDAVLYLKIPASGVYYVSVSIEGDVRRSLTREGLQELMGRAGEIRSGSPFVPCLLRRRGHRGSLGLAGLHIDADLYSDDERVFRDVQGVKKRLNVNIEFVRPKTSSRHWPERPIATSSSGRWGSEFLPLDSLRPAPVESGSGVSPETCRTPRDSSPAAWWSPSDSVRSCGAIPDEAYAG